MKINKCGMTLKRRTRAQFQKLSRTSLHEILHTILISTCAISRDGNFSHSSFFLNNING